MINMMYWFSFSIDVNFHVSNTGDLNSSMYEQKQPVLYLYSMNSYEDYYLMQGACPVSWEV